SPHHAGPAGLCLPAQPLCACQSGTACPGAHPPHSLRSMSSAGPPHLARSHFSSAHLSVVLLAQNPSVLGWVLSSSPSPESWLSLFVEPPSPTWTVPGNSPGKTHGNRPGSSPGTFPPPFPVYHS